MATPRLSDAVREKIEKLLAENKSSREIAKTLGVGTGTISNVRNGLIVTSESQVARAMAQAKAAQQGRAAMLRRISELEDELDEIRSLSDVLSGIVPMPFPAKAPRKRHAAIPFLLASDWHIDETVDRAAMNGLNEYNTKIAKERVETLFSAVVDILSIYKKNSDMNTMVIAMLGDLCSNWLHEELVETNTMTPPEALLMALDMVTGGIDYVLASGAVEHILLVGAVGNHGRITKKPQSKRRAQKNYEWILYSLLARHYAGRDERVRVQMPTGYFSYVEALGRTIRCHHGDAIRYQGGIGGVHIPLKKALAQWNRAKKADLDLMGHWHQCEFSRDYVINGSLIGYNEYGEQIKAEPEPPTQAMFLLHSKYGATGFYPLRVGK